MWKSARNSQQTSPPFLSIEKQFKMLLHQRKSLYRALVIWTALVCCCEFLRHYMDPLWFEAFPCFKNLLNYGFVFACTISARNVCQKWTFATGYNYKLISFPVIKIQTSFGLFCPPDIVNFRLKSLFVITYSKYRVNKFNLPFWRSRRNAHTFDIVLVGMEHSNSKCHLTSCRSHHPSLIIFWCKTEVKTLQARQVNLLRLPRSLSRFTT